MKTRPKKKDDLLDWKITDAPRAFDADEAPAPAPAPAPASPAVSRPPGPSHWAHQRWPRAALLLVAGVIGLALTGASVYSWWTRANTRRAIEQALAREVSMVAAVDVDDANDIAEMKAFYNAENSDWGQAYLKWALDNQTAPRPQPFLHPLTTTGQLTLLEPFASNIMRGEVARPFSNTQGQVLTFTTTYFFAFTDDHWQRVAPPDNFWGVQQAYLSPYLTIFYWEPDQPLVEALGPYLNHLLAQACAEWDCPADYKYELYLTDTLPNPLTLSKPPSDAQPTDPLLFDVLISHRLYAREPIFRMASPRIMGYPADSASRAYFQRVLGWLALGQTSAHLGYRVAQNVNPLLNPLYFGLLAETGTRLGLDAPVSEAPMVVNNLAELSWIGGQMNNSFSLTEDGARAKLRPALAFVHQLVRGESARTQTRLLEALWEESSGMDWLAKGLNLSPQATQARFDEALLRGIQIQSQVSGDFDWALSCSAGPAMLALNDGEVRYLLNEGGNQYYGGSLVWAADGQRLLIGGYGLLADMSSGQIRWVGSPLAGFPDRYTLLTDDVVAYIVWADYNTPDANPTSSLYFQNLRDPHFSPPPIEGVRNYALSPGQQLMALAYLPDSGADISNAHLSVISTIGKPGEPPVWEGEGALPGWSPDGQTLLYSQFDADGFLAALYHLDIQTGVSQPLLTPNGSELPLETTYAQAVWSPTSEWLAVATSGQTPTNQLWLMRPDGAERRRLMTHQNFIGPPTFSADGQFVAAIVYPPDSLGELQILTVATGELVQTITNLNAYDWSPTGHQVALAQNDGLYQLTEPAAGPQRINNTACYSVAWNPKR